MRSSVAFPFLIIAAILLGCSWFRDDAANTNATNGANTAASNTIATSDSPAPTSPLGDPATEINAMADRFLGQKAFRLTMTGKGDKETRTELEFVAPDRFRMKTGPGLERIFIGNDMYLSMGDGSWQKLPGAAGAVPDLRAIFDEEGRKWFSDVRYVGEEPANGKPSHVYEYKNRGTGNAGENDSKVWIAKDNGLPVKIESRYRSGNLRSMIIEYDYDPNIKIEAPKT